MNPSAKFTIKNIGEKPLKDRSAKELQEMLDVALRAACFSAMDSNCELYPAIAGIIETEVDRRDTLTMIEGARKDAAQAHKLALWSLWIAAGVGLGQIVVSVIGMMCGGK
jgi:hypothetical protein